MKKIITGIGIALIVTVVITGIGSLINYNTYRKTGELRWCSDIPVGAEGTVSGFGGWRISYDRTGHSGEPELSLEDLLTDGAMVFILANLLIGVIHATNRKETGRDGEIRPGGKGAMRLGRGDVRNLLNK